MNQPDILKLNDRVRLRKKLADFPAAVESNPPEKWWQKSARLVLGAERELRQNPFETPEATAYILGVLNQAKARLREHPQNANVQPEVAEVVNEVMMAFSRDMAQRFSPESLDIKENRLSLEQLSKMFPDRFRVAVGDEILGLQTTDLFVNHPTTKEEFKVILPHTTLAHKGGAPRMVLDVLAGSDIKMQSAELPFHDFDVVIAGDHSQKFALARAIGADHDGIEYADNLDDFAMYCGGRDTDHNQVWLDYRGLRYTDAALKAAKTGIIKIESDYVPAKAIYGVDRTVLDGLEMDKQRGMARMMKFVIEEKAKGFYYRPVNANLDVGIFALFLSKRWMKRDQFPDYLQRMFHLLGQMDQTLVSEQSITDVLERAHKKYEQFDFSSEFDSVTELVRWKSRKLAKQIDRETSWVASLPTEFSLRRAKNDTIPHLVSLRGYQYNEREAERIRKWWPRFVRESQKRTDEAKFSEKPMYQRIFFADLESD